MQTPFEVGVAKYNPIKNTLADRSMYDGRLFKLTAREKLADKAAQNVRHLPSTIA